MEQLVARRAHNPKVVGSSPALATQTIKRFYFDSITVFFILIVIYQQSNILIKLLLAPPFAGIDNKFHQQNKPFYQVEDLGF